MVKKISSKFGIKTVNNPCVSQSDCDSGQKCYENICRKECISDNDCLEFASPNSIWQCSEPEQICVGTTFTNDGDLESQDPSKVYEFGGIFDAWNKRDTPRYWDNVAWFITNYLALFEPLMPIKCDFLPRDFQDIQVAGLNMKVGHTECEYTPATRWSGSSEWVGERASCKDVAGEHIIKECEKKCNMFKTSSKEYEAKSGCDGGVAWCWCTEK